MELQLFGINHKTSKVSERERFIINETNQIILDNHFKNLFKFELESFFGISTCNRTEIYLYGKKNISKKVCKETFKCLNIQDISSENLYFLDGHDAMVHMCKVASGIDSQVLGEQEIFGQFKNALHIARQNKFLKRNLLILSNKVIEISKFVRTKTGIGLNPLSVSGLALKLLKNIFEEPSEQNVLILGAGSLAKNVIDNLFDSGINKIKSINRTKKRIEIKNNFKILSSTLDSLHDEIKLSDVIIASATTEVPIIGKGAVENALTARKNKPMLLIDLGVPRNIEEEIKSIEQVYLYSIDDIEKITQENYGQRTIEAEKAINLIALKANEALDILSSKTNKDKINQQLEEFLKGLSKEEVNQFKLQSDYSDLIKSIKTMEIKDLKLNNFQDIKNLDNHILESMIKNFFKNA